MEKSKSSYAILRKRLYEIIRSTKADPWEIFDYVMAEDEYEADAYAYRKYGASGYRTVQKADVVKW